MAPKPRYSDGEKVLCYHGPLLYEAKCIKYQIKEKMVKYFIHYSGWNKNWDEWVPESRVLRYNDVNLQKQREGMEAILGTVKKTKTVKSSSKKESSDRESSALPHQEKTPKQKGKEAVPTPTPPTESQAELQRKKRTRAEQNIENEEDKQKLEIEIIIPDELKHWLVDDWYHINREKKLVQLPARMPVETILSEYVKQRTSVKETLNEVSAIIETVNGIRDHFNTMLGKQLLYKFERPQYDEVMSENGEHVYLITYPSQVYGAMHLLRLFSKISGVLACTNWLHDDVSNRIEDSEILSFHLNDFVKYLSERATSLFSLSDYTPATPEYLVMAGMSSTQL